MKISSAISTMALSAFMLAGISRAQEPVAAASSSDDANASPQTANLSVSTNSKVRIVRLSEVRGEVQLDRQTGKGFESAMANLPVTEGEKLKTGDGVVEVEFEDNSTVRVAQNSLVEFPRLELLPSGAKASTINVLQGMVYVSLVKTKGNEFTVKFGQQTVNLPPDSHIRVELTPKNASMAVMHGDALVEESSGSTTVSKNRTATFDGTGENQPVIAKSVAEQPLDSWDQNAVQYHQSYANASSFGNVPYAYGINDMNYYGSFASGCGGSMWRPYFASASWDPYGSGAWAYYPSAGYSWVSPYPWGWTPYHYGSWAFCQGVGWGWMPGGNWMGLANNTFASSPTSSSPNRLHPPINPPATAQSSLVPVNLKGIPTSSLGAHDTFVFRKDSAGMGVPRGSLGKLNGVSNHVAQHGTANMNVYYGGERSAAQEQRTGNLEQSSYPAANRFPGGMQGPSGGMGAHTSVQSGPAGGGGGHK